MIKSKYDEPGLQPGDPLPVDGEEQLTQQELANLRIQNDIAVLDSREHENLANLTNVFNNMAVNVRGLLQLFERKADAYQARITVLEGQVRALDGQLKNAQKRGLRREKGGL